MWLTSTAGFLSSVFHKPELGRSNTSSPLRTWKGNFVAKMQTGRVINTTQGTVIIDHQMLEVLDTLHTLYVDADIAIRARTQGFMMTYV